MATAKKRLDRPSPKVSATLYDINTRRRGNDGNWWQVAATTTGVRRWKMIAPNNQKSNSKKQMQSTITKSARVSSPTVKCGRSYLIHNNGARPFKVCFSGPSKADVYSTPVVKVGHENYVESHDKKTHTQFVVSFTFAEKFIGADVANPGYAGNTLLLRLSANKYVMFSAYTVYSFSTPDNDTISKLFSPVGNSDVPYPVARGEKYVYFLLAGDRTCVPRSEFEFGRTNFADAYGEYYDRKLHSKAEKLPKSKILFERQT